MLAYGEVQRSAVASVVIVAVEDEDLEMTRSKLPYLLSLSSKKTGHNALLQSGSENDGIILSISKSGVLNTLNGHWGNGLHNVVQNARES